MKPKIILSLLGLLLVSCFSLNVQELTTGAKTGKIPAAEKKTRAFEKAGEIAPDFTLSDLNGKQITLSKANKPVILVFYRGYWCPFCARQLSELRGLLKPGENVSLYAVSIDTAEKSKGMIEKIAKDGKGNVAFQFLSDPDHKTIDAFGILDPAYIGEKFEGIPHPAVYILDKNRRVVWAKVESDYRKRPTNTEIRAELDKLK